MKIISKITEKILSYCSTCGGCPMGKIMDAQAEMGRRDSFSISSKTLREISREKMPTKESKARSPKSSP